MSAFHIRRGTAADMPFFQEMELQTTWENLASMDRDRVTQESLREALAGTHELLLARPGNVLFVAESEAGEPVGLLWFGENRNLITGEMEAWVYNVSVLPAYRGRGVGGQLMAHAEQHARRGGYATIGLMVAQHNTGAQRLYARRGFETTNLVMRRRLE